MIDAVVTTPMKLTGQAKAEAIQVREWHKEDPDSALHYHRDYKFKPFVEKGDRVYYVEDYYIRGYCIVDYVFEKSMGVWRVKMDARSWTWIYPIPMTGFQGIRKFKLSRDLITEIGDWEVPMPVHYPKSDTVLVNGERVYK